jgi:hypothetical protein
MRIWRWRGCLDNILWIASKTTLADAELIPTEIQPLKGTLMDFNVTRIGNRIEQLKPKMNGYDHNYILGEGALKMAPRLGGTSEAGG